MIMTVVYIVIRSGDGHCSDMIILGTRVRALSQPLPSGLPRCCLGHQSTITLAISVKMQRVVQHGTVCHGNHFKFDLPDPLTAGGKFLGRNIGHCSRDEALCAQRKDSPCSFYNGSLGAPRHEDDVGRQACRYVENSEAAVPGN